MAIPLFKLTPIGATMYNNNMCFTHAVKGNDKMSFLDREPKFIEDKPSKFRDYAKQGVTTFLAILLGVVSFFVFRFDAIASAIGTIMGVLSPIIYGLVIAFLVNPIVKKVEKFIIPFILKVIKKEERAKKTARGIGILSALVIVLAIIVALLNMVIPELYKSIRDLVVTLPDQITEWVKFVNDIIETDTNVGNILKTVVLESSAALEKWVETDLLNWVQTDLLEHTNTIVTGLTTGVISVVNVVMDIVIGMIVSIYVLFGKEKFACQSKKVVYAVMKPRTANNLLHVVKKADEIFTGFIVGKIIDSAIIGVLCFIGVSILKMPYALLVSVIVGVTNVIPFFGPYIGAIPSAILILIVDPLKGLYFIIFIILLQQLDGNVIGPKILGNSTGLSSFWVVFSILVFGGLFGIVGMIIGVPTFALIYYVVKMYVQERLEKKKLPIETDCYTKDNYVDEKGVFISLEEKTEKEEETDANSSTE